MLRLILHDYLTVLQFPIYLNSIVKKNICIFSLKISFISVSLVVVFENHVLKFLSQDILLLPGGFLS